LLGWKPKERFGIEERKGVMGNEGNEGNG